MASTSARPTSSPSRSTRAVVRARVKAHLEIARSGTLLAATLEAAAEGILVTNRSGGISHMNEAFRRMWDIPADLRAEPGTTQVFALMEAQARDGDLYRRQWAAAVARTEPQEGFDAIELTRDRHVERHARAFRINANLSGHVFSFHDVTDRNRATRELKLLNESLEARIAERTRELELAMHQATAANRAKSQFLSNMSHEIRTPINGVIGMAILALQANPDPRQREFLEKIQGAGQHLAEIVNDVLDFSKIEAGELRLEETEVDVRGVLDEVSSQLLHAAEGKGLQLTFQSDPDLPRALRGDRLRIKQVLLNFVGNAIKFTPKGAVQVRVASLPCDDDECLLRFEIEDSGIGMTEAQIGALFQSFHQADASTTREYGGTGLGLAISKQLAAAMGGEVGVRSAPGRGSTFWFTARLRPAQGGLAKPTAPAGEPAPGDRYRDVIQGAHILLVEDNFLNREVATGLLESVGAIVSLASNGKEAVDLSLGQPFACILMDMQMPVMDGLEATRLIRAQPLRAATPILAMTANCSDEDRLRCIEAGMDDFMTKPMLPETLYTNLARWIPGRPVQLLPVEAPASALSSAAAAHEPSAPTGDPAVIDLSILSRSVAGDAEKVRRYAGMFAEAIPQTLAELATTLASGDLPLLADLGHRLKASSTMVGAMGFAAMCQELESLRSGGTLAQASALVEKMPALLAKVSAELERERA